MEEIYWFLFAIGFAAIAFCELVLLAMVLFALTSMLCNNRQREPELLSDEITDKELEKL